MLLAAGNKKRGHFEAPTYQIAEPFNIYYVVQIYHFPP